LNPTLGNDIVATFTMNNLESTSLYDLIEIDEEMVLLMVKERLNSYRIRKVIVDECTNPLAWWKAHEP
jgi:hypothetical protein